MSEQRSETVTTPIATDVNAYRRAVRERLQAELTRERARMEREGRYAYAGAWLSLSEIEAAQSSAVKRDRAVLFELVSVYVVMALADVGLFIVLRWVT